MLRTQCATPSIFVRVSARAIANSKSARLCVFLQQLKLRHLQILTSLVGVLERLCTQRDKGLDADSVENLLQSGYRHGLIEPRG
jgi:hypothetical protein